MKFRFHSLAVCALLLAAPAWSDRVVFSNGDVMTGTVTSLSGGKLAIQTPYANRIVVDAAEVASLTTDDGVNLRLASGEKLYGRLVDVDGKTQIEALNRDLALADLSKLTRNNSSVFAEADWSHKIDLAASVTNGNSNTQSLSLFTESTLAQKRNEHSLLSAIFRDEDNELTTRDQLDVSYAFRRFVSEKWFWAANGEYFRDRLNDIDPRITAGTGAGYRFWDNSLGALTVELGVSAVYEDFGGEESTNPAGRWALDYRRLLFGERLEFFHRHQILTIFDSDRGEVVEASTGLRLLFADWWNASIRTDVRHETDPPPGNRRSDVTHAIGVGLRF